MVGMDGGPIEHNLNGPPEQLTLNYVFADPSEGEIPSPLPLTVPYMLLKAPAASIRTLVAENLESEGITVKTREMRLWRVRQSL